MSDQALPRSLSEVVAAHRIVTLQEWYLRVGDSYIQFVEPEDKERVRAEMEGLLSRFREELDALSEFQRGIVYGKMYALSWVLREPDTDLEDVSEFVQPR